LRWTESSVLSTENKDSSNTSYMSNVRILSIAMLTLVSVNVMSQTSNTAPGSGDSIKHSALPSILGGIGVTYFDGNINHSSGVTPYSTVRTGYSLGVEERPVMFLGVALEGMYGQIASSERSEVPAKNLNFQATVIQGELTLNLHFDGLIMKPDAVLSPFIYAGISFLSGNSYADTRDAKGEPYYYWTDGSIRNEAQVAQNISTAKIIQRSYKYDSLLGPISTLCIPVGVGLKFRLTDNILMNVQAAYYFTFSNDLENYKNLATDQAAGSTTSSASSALKNEKYLYSVCTIEYHFTPKDNSPKVDESRYSNVPWQSIDVKVDTVKVNTKDISKDQEDELLKKEQNRDTSAVDRAAAFFANPNAGGGIVTGIDNGATGTHDPSKVPARIRAVDKNHDGYITSQEITQAIDEFFDGTSTLTIADINYAIDYFFDQ
jgi:hypothetical protein